MDDFISTVAKYMLDELLGEIEMCLHCEITKEDVPENPGMVEYTGEYDGVRFSILYRYSSGIIRFSVLNCVGNWNLLSEFDIYAEKIRDIRECMRKLLHAVRIGIELGEMRNGREDK